MLQTECFPNRTSGLFKVQIQISNTYISRWKGVRRAQTNHIYSHIFNILFLFMIFYYRNGFYVYDNSKIKFSFESKAFNVNEVELEKKRGHRQFKYKYSYFMSLMY